MEPWRPSSCAVPVRQVTGISPLLYSMVSSLYVDASSILYHAFTLQPLTLQSKNKWSESELIHCCTSWKYKNVMFFDDISFRLQNSSMKPGKACTSATRHGSFFFVKNHKESVRVLRTHPEQVGKVQTNVALRFREENLKARMPPPCSIQLTTRTRSQPPVITTIICYWRVVRATDDVAKTDERHYITI
jgi:hypothetical protein